MSNTYYLPSKSGITTLFPMGLYINMNLCYHIQLDIRTNNVVLITDNLSLLKENKHTEVLTIFFISGWQVLQELLKNDRPLFTRIRYTDDPIDQNGKNILHTTICRLTKKM